MTPQPLSSPLYFLPTSSSLSEDSILTANLPIASLANGPSVALFQRSATRTDALAVLVGLGLCYIVDSDTEAGWKVTQLPTASPVTALLAGIDEQSHALHAFYTDSSGNLFGVTLISGGSTWGKPQTLGQVTSLKLTATVNGHLVAYGVTPAGQLLVVSELSSGSFGVGVPSPGALWPKTVKVPGKKLTAAMQTTLVVMTATKWVIMTVTASGKNTNLNFYTGVYGSSKPAKACNPITTPQPVTKVIGGYASGNATQTVYGVFLLTGQNGLLYSVSDDSLYSKPFFAKVSNTEQEQMLQYAIMQDAKGLLHVHAVDSKNRLWLRTMTSWPPPGQSLPWSDNVPIMKDVLAVITGVNTQSVHSFFTVGTQDNLLLYSEYDAAAQAWITIAPQQDAAVPYALAQYRTQVTVVFEDGTPVRGATLTVGASSPSFIRVDGLSYAVGPESEVAIQANMMGTVTIATPATQLFTPTLTVSAGSGATTVTVKPDADVHAYLTGAGGLNALPPLSGPLLQTAKINGQPLSPMLANMTPYGQATNLAADAAQTIKNIMGIKPKPASSSAQQTATQAAPQTAGFALDLSDPENSSYQTFQSQQDLANYQANGPDPVKLNWFAPNVFRGVETGAIAVNRWVVNAENATVTITMKLENGATEAVELAVETLEQVVSLAQSVFNALEIDIRRAILWLSAVFNWPQIWNTAQAIEQAYSVMFKWSKENLKTIQKDLSESMSEVQAQMNAKIGDLINELGQQSISAQLNALVPPAPGRSPGVAASCGAFATSPLQGPAGPLSLAAVNRNVQNGWLLDKVLTYAGNASYGSALPAFNTSAITTFLNSVQSNSGAFTAELETFEEYFTRAVATPKDFANLALAALLTAAEPALDAVFSLATVVMKLFFDALQSLLNYIESTLNTPLQLPLVTDLYTRIQLAIAPKATPQPLTLCRLVSLMFAIPVTAAYKLAYGLNTQPFPNGAAGVGAPAADAASAADTLSAPKIVAASFTFAAAIAQAVWAPIDTGLDLLVKSPGWMIQALGVVMPLGINLLSLPLPWPTAPLTVPGVTALTYFFASFVPTLIDTMTLSCLGGLARYLAEPGCILMSAAGLFNFAMACVASICAKPFNLLDAYGNVMGTFSSVFAFLRIPSLQDSTGETAFIAAAYIDVFSGEISAVASITGIFVLAA